MPAKIHKSLTVARITKAAERQMFGTDDPGFCIKCGDEVSGCEPDARKYPCDECGTNTVFGAEELLFHVMV